MTNPTHQPPDQPSEITLRARNAFRVAVVMLIPSTAITLFFFYLAVQTLAWQLYITAVASLVFDVFIGISLRLIRRGRPELGMGLIIGSFLPIILLSSALIAKIGLFMGVGLVLMILAIATPTLSRRGASRAITASIVVGIVVELLAVFGNPHQLPVPESFPFLLDLVGVGIVVYIFFIARQFANYTLRTKLIIAFLAVALIPLGVLSFLNNRDTRAVLTDEANQALFGAASQTAVSLDTFIETNLDAVRAEALAPVLVKYLNLPPDRRPDSLEEAEVAATLRSFGLKEPIYITSYALLDIQGLVVADTAVSESRLNEFDSDYFQTPLQTGLPYVSPVEFSQTTGEAALYFASPVRNASGEIVGVLRVRYNAAILQQFIVQSTRLAKSQSFGVLFDENHLHLAHATAPETIFKLAAPPETARVAELQAAGRLPNRPLTDLSTNLPDLEQSLANAMTQPFFTATDAATGNKIDQVAVAEMETRPWLVAFFEPQEVFLAPAEAQTRSTLLLAVLIAVMVVAAAVGMGQLLARPITRLTAVAQQVAAGDLNIQAPVESQDETGQLAATFNGMTAQLRDLVGSLEEQVRERTAELALSMEVGQRASALRNLDELLPTITELIRERFDLYYAQFYFVDDINQNLVLRAGTGTVGEKLLARDHSLPVDSGSIVGRVAAEGRSVIVSDTETSDIFKPNPLLPETRSELAAPLIVEERVIGVLDMQASQVGTFTTENLTVFEAMATQLAISIDGAQQWAIAQQAQQKSEEAIRQLTRENWAERLASQKTGLGFAYDLFSVTPLEPTGPPSKTQNGEISVSVTVQNEPIGYISVEKPADKTWSRDEQVMLETVAQQLAQKAENLRLFEDTQQRATREHLTREITDKMRASPDIDSIIQVGVRELAKVLGGSHTVVELNLSDEEN